MNLLLLFSDPGIHGMTAGKANVFLAFEATICGICCAIIFIDLFFFDKKMKSSK